MAASSVGRNVSLQELSSDLSNGSSALFHRRIEFHPARKPYRGFVNGVGDFRIETLNPSPESGRSGVGSGQPGFVGKKSDISEESVLDPELNFGITFKSIGAGLENMGNTCYLNSVLQCLTYTEPLAAYLQSGKHKNSCRIAGFCALCAIQKHVSRALQSTGRCLSPHEIVANLKCISRNFRSWRQEDAHEYMVNLLESMHKCCLPSGVPSESPGAYEKSLVHKIFGGSLRSQVKCMQCSYGSNKYDPFLDLSLEIHKADSLEKALLNFTAPELLDGGERQYQCERCRQKVRARKQLTVHKPPYVLTIHLKRFRAHDHNSGQKIDKKVNFSPTLDLRPFVSDPQGGNMKYTLYGVLVHHGGSTRSGHYYCFVRTSSGIWHSLDDNRVSSVSEKRVLEQKAYMLFYVRDRSDIIPRKPSNVSIKENIKANESQKINSLANGQILRKLVQNGPTDVKLNGVAPSAAVAQKDVVCVTPTLISFSAEKLNQTKLEQPTTTSHSKTPSELVSLQAKMAGQDKKPVVESSNNNESNDKRSSDKSLIVSALTSTIPDEVQCSALAKDTSIESLKENHPAPLVDGVSFTSSKEAIAQSIENVDSVKQPVQSGCEHSSVGNDSALHKKSDECRENSAVEKSAKLPDLSSLPSISTDSDDSDYEPVEKSKKKIVRRQVASLSLRSNFFIRASLALKKRRKHKKSKSRSSVSKKLTKELLVDNITFSDIGPSTSEISNTISSDSTHSQRKETISTSRIEADDTASQDINNSDGEYLKSIPEDGEFKKRISQNGCELARDNQLPIHSQPNFRSSGNQETGMLTQGLGETIIPRWDEEELPRNNVLQSCAVQSATIGYIGDEWDEEYDRGKRKKVRQAKLDFDGKNPFQEIATNRAKKAKIDRSRSGNQPFRI